MIDTYISWGASYFNYLQHNPSAFFGLTLIIPLLFVLVYSTVSAIQMSRNENITFNDTLGIGVLLFTLSIMVSVLVVLAFFFIIPLLLFCVVIVAYFYLVKNWCTEYDKVKSSQENARLNALAALIKDDPEVRAQYEKIMKETEL